MLSSDNFILLTFIQIGQSALYSLIAWHNYDHILFAPNDTPYLYSLFVARNAQAANVTTFQVTIASGSSWC